MKNSRIGALTGGALRRDPREDSLERKKFVNRRDPRGFTEETVLVTMSRIANTLMRLILDFCSSFKVVKLRVLLSVTVFLLEGAW